MINSGDKMGGRKNLRDKQRGNPEVLITLVMGNRARKRLN